MTAKILKFNTPQLLSLRPLGKHGSALWQAVTTEYGIEDAGGVEMLTLACQASTVPKNSPRRSSVTALLFVAREWSKTIQA